MGIKEDDTAALNAAREFIECFNNRSDHSMIYWAYEGDAIAFARYIVSGIYEKVIKSQ